MNKKKIFQLLKKAIGFLFIALLLHKVFWWEPSRVINYKEIIKGEKINNISSELCCESLKDIENIENSILTEIAKKSGQKPLDNLELSKAKEELRRVEQDYGKFKEDYEQQEALFKEKILTLSDSFSEEERKIISNYGNSWVWLVKLTGEKKNIILEKVRNLAIKNIKNNLESVKLGINDLNTDLVDGIWGERSIWHSLLRDPQRFILIQPLQFISRKAGINISSNILYAFFDIFFKVLIIRLILNLISYPPNLNLAEREQPKSINNIYILEEERKKNEEQIKIFKQFLFNFGIMLSTTFCFYFHPFAFNIESNLYVQQTSLFLIIPSILFSLISGYLISNYHQKKTPFLEYIEKNWLMSLILPSLFFSMIYFSGGAGNQLGRHLPILLGELINIFIYIIMIIIHRKKWKLRN